MEIGDVDAFLRERLNPSWEVDDGPDRRGGVPLGVDTALLAFEPHEWCRYWATRAVDRDTVWLAYRLVVVWAGPPLYRMSVQEVEEAVASALPGLVPELRDFAMRIRAGVE